MWKGGSLQARNGEFDMGWDIFEDRWGVGFLIKKEVESGEVEGQRKKVLGYINYLVY